MNAPYSPSRRDLLKGTASLVVTFSLIGSRSDAIAQAPRDRPRVVVRH
jgi:uncharacterized protein (DUF1501 family)